MVHQGSDVYFVPKADIARCRGNTSLFDHLGPTASTMLVPLRSTLGIVWGAKAKPLDLRMPRQLCCEHALQESAL